MQVGRVKAVHAHADVVSNAQGNRCVPPRAVVHTVVLPERERGTPVVFVVFSALGVPDAPADLDIHKILSSLRPQ